MWSGAGLGAIEALVGFLALECEPVRGGLQDGGS